MIAQRTFFEECGFRLLTSGLMVLLGFGIHTTAGALRGWLLELFSHSEFGSTFVMLPILLMELAGLICLFQAVRVIVVGAPKKPAKHESGDH